MNTLALKNLTVTREGSVVLDSVSLEVASGEVHIIMGPNGSGKSTLFNAVMGHPAYKVTEGAMLFNNDDIIALPTEKKASTGIFLSMQYLPAVDGVTMLTFLHRAHRMIKGSDISILDFYKELSEKVKEFGLDESLLKRFVNVGFSGGEKKQAQIIELLALEPAFALLDEIDSGVDIDSLDKVFKAIEKLRKQGTGFVIVTHLGSILEKINPDRVSVMKEGKVVRTGGADLARKVLEKGFEGK
jgi:Fe-S cluster assembly ATP-binding protein